MSATSIIRTWYVPAYAIVIVIVALSHTRWLGASAAQIGIQPSLPEAVLNVSGDSYVLIPWLFMAWIVGVATHLAGSTDSIVLLRYGSRLRWLLARGVVFVRDALLLVGVTVVAAAVTAPGLPLTPHWTQAPWGLIGNTLLESWSTSGVSPLVALLLQSVLTVCGLVAIAMMAAAVALSTSRYRHLGLVIVLAAGFLVPLLLVRLPFSGALESLVILARRGLPGWPVTPILLVAAISAVVVAAVAVSERRRPPLRPVSVATVLYLLLVGVLLGVGARGSGGSTFADLVATLFHGAGPADFRVTTFTVSMLIFLGPAYLALLRIVEVDLPRLPLLAVRHGRVWPWLRTIAVRSFLTGVALVLGLALLSLVLAAVTGHDLSAAPTVEAWHQVLVNGALQVYVSTMLVVLVALLSGSDVAGVWAILALVVLAIPPLTHGLAPSGQSMLGLLQGGASPWRGTVVLAAATVLLTGAAYVTTTRPALQRLITGSARAHH